MNLEQFKSIFPKNKKPEVWLPYMGTLSGFGISSKEQVAAFCQQIGHESLDMTILEENLNYSAEGLLRTFPKYFDSLTAAACARKPQDIANVVYANRMGNGNTSSGDGWKFRGRGVLQLTGRQNYTAYSLSMLHGDLMIEDPDRLIEPEYAINSGIWFWTKNRLDLLTDIVEIQRRVNGGTVGLDDRVARYKTALSVL